MKTQKRSSTNKMVLGAILTALVIILQLMGSFIRFGPFSISLVLIPIVIGAATCGVAVSTWLGFTFSVAVLLSGDAGAFLAVNVPGTIITVIAKGTLAGLCSGLVYNSLLSLLDKYSAGKIKQENKYIAVLVSAIICPVVNTCIFLLGCRLFFMETITQWAVNANLGANVGKFMIVGLVGANFLFELLFNIVLSPVIVRIVQARNK